ncbi:MAG: hypothetical protein DBX47_06435 [Clostridiales bacterium]|nr:MAG: hypothetical protein DBX47_06435 [Clostridiales bacterium]
MINMSKIDFIDKYPAVTEIISNMSNEIWGKCILEEKKAGEYFFKIGDPVEFVCILCQGTAIISNENLSGTQTRVVFVGEGYTIGEMESLAKEGTLVYSAKSYTNCSIIKIPVNHFLQWVKSDNNIAYMMAVFLAKKLIVASNEASTYTHYESIVRLASLLIAEGTGIINKNRQELAEICGVSVRTINRCINRLKNNNFISIYKGKIKISKEQQEKLIESQYNFYNFEK